VNVSGYQTINVSASDITVGLDSIVIFVDGSSVLVCGSSPCNYTWNTSAVSDGSYSFNATANDTLGNNNISLPTRTVTVDNTVPNISFELPTPGDGVNVSGYQTINVSASDITVGLDSIVIFVDGSSVLVCGSSPCNYTWNTTAAIDGSYSFNATANDTQGNTNTSLPTRTVTVDNTAPTVSLVSPTGSSPSVNPGSSLAVSFTYSDNNTASFLIQVWNSTDIIASSLVANTTGGTNITNTTTITLPAMADGYYNVNVSVTDQVSLSANATESNAITVDTVVPVVVVDSPSPAENLSSSSVWFNASVFDVTTPAGLNVTVEVDGANYSLSNSSGNWWYLNGSMPEGNYTARFYGNDSAGNMNASETVSFTVDTVDPTSVISTANFSNVSTATPLINGTASDGGSGVRRVWVSVDEGVYALATGDTSWSYMTGSLGEGLHNVSVKPEDFAGNNASALQLIYVTVDTVDPTSVISTANFSNVSTATPLINGTASDGGSGVRRVWVSVDEGVYALATGDTSWSYMTGSLGEGLHNVSVKPEDFAGNNASALQLIYVTVDTVDPTVSFVLPSNTTYPAASQLVNVSVVDASTAIVLVEVNGSVNVTLENSGASFWNATYVFSEGANNVRVYANDSAGNMNASETVSFTVDTTVPTVDTVSLDDYVVQGSATVTVNYTVTETNPVSYWVELNGVNTTGTSTSATVTAPGSDGSYTVTVWANDTAGNEGSNSSWTLIVDTTNPVVSIVSPTGSSPAINPVSPLSVSFTYTESNTVSFLIQVWNSTNIIASSIVTNATGGTNIANTTAISLPAMADGYYNINVSIADEANLSGNGTELNAILVDTTAPLVTFTSPGNITTTDNTPLLNVTFNEAVNSSYYVVDNVTASTPVSGVTNLTTVLSPLSDGPHNVTVYANDSYDNLNTSIQYFTVDTTPPSVTIVSPSNNTLPGATQTINVSVTDASNIGSVLAEVNGSTNVSLSLTGGYYTTSYGFSEGANSIRIYANDSQGTMNSSEVEYFSIDVNAPTISVSRPLQNEVFSVSNGSSGYGNLTIVYSVTDDIGVGSVWYNISSSAFANVSTSVTFSNSTVVLADGSYVLIVYANDTAGNAFSATRNFEVNTTYREAIFNSTGTNISTDSAVDSGSSFSNSTVNSSTVSTSNVTQTNVSDSTLENSNLTTSTVDDSNVTDSVVVDSTVNGSSDVSNSTLENSTVTGSTLDEVVAYNLTISGTNLTNATVSDAVIINFIIDGTTNATIVLNISGISVNFTNVYTDANVSDLITTVNVSTHNQSDNTTEQAASGSHPSAGDYYVNLSTNASALGRLEASFNLINPGGQDLPSHVSGTRFLNIEAPNFNNSVLSNATVCVSLPSGYENLVINRFNGTAWVALDTWTAGTFICANTSGFSVFGISGSVFGGGGQILGGGGGGPVIGEDKTTTAEAIAPTEEGVLAQVEASFSDIPQGKRGTILIPFTENMPLTEVAVDVINKVTNVKITIKSQDQKPEDILQYLTGDVLRFIRIEKTNIIEADIGKVSIKFKIDKAFLEQNEIDPAHIVLNRFIGGKWNALPTSKTSEDDKNVYYSADSPGLSWFAISVKVPAPAPVETEAPVETSAPTPEATKAPTPTRAPTEIPPPTERPVPTTPAPTEAPVPTPPPFYKKPKNIITAIIVLLIVVVIVIVRTKRSIREEVAKLKKQTERLKDQMKKGM